MNERIKQLAEQATSVADVKYEGCLSKGYTEQVVFFDKKKFAKLLLAEVDKIVDELYHELPLGQAVVLITFDERLKSQLWIEE